MASRKIRVFISYSHDSEKHKIAVYSLANHLRKEKGIEAVLDEILKQQQTAIDFVTMMNSAIAESDKVIIVLSKGYKQKSGDVEKGVGHEYQTILKEIDSNPQKYILVSFEGRMGSVVPSGFQTREVIDLSPSVRAQSIKAVLSKIVDKPKYVFADTAETQPEIEPEEIPPFISGRFMSRAAKKNVTLFVLILLIVAGVAYYFHYQTEADAKPSTKKERTVGQKKPSSQNSSTLPKPNQDSILVDDVIEKYYFRRDSLNATLPYDLSTRLGILKDRTRKNKLDFSSIGSLFAPSVDTFFLQYHCRPEVVMDRLKTTLLRYHFQHSDRGSFSIQRFDRGRTKYIVKYSMLYAFRTNESAVYDTMYLKMVVKLDTNNKITLMRDESDDKK